jgi:hypothetical protein
MTIIINENKAACIRVIDRILGEIFMGNSHMKDNHLAEIAHMLETCKAVLAKDGDEMDAYFEIQDLIRDEMNGRYIRVGDAVLDWLHSNKRGTMFGLRLSVVRQIAALYTAESPAA